MNNLTTKEIEKFAKNDFFSFLHAIGPYLIAISSAMSIYLWFYFENYMFTILPVIGVIAIVVKYKIDNKEKATIISKVENFLPNYESKYNSELLQAINDKRLSFIKDEDEQLKIKKIKELYEENVKLYEDKLNEIQKKI